MMIVTIIPVGPVRQQRLSDVYEINVHEINSTYQTCKLMRNKIRNCVARCAVRETVVSRDAKYETNVRNCCVVRRAGPGRWRPRDARCETNAVVL